MKLVYIAGPYTPQNPALNNYCQREGYINTARNCAAWCATNGIAYYSPHLNSAHMDVIVPEVKWEFWLRLDVRILSHCDGLILLPRWEKSKGVLMEREEAECLVLPIFEYPKDSDAILEWGNDAT